MPRVQVNGVELYYERHGAGTPLCLIEGIGYASWMWQHQIDAFAARHEVIAFDNRDVGQSDQALRAYRIRDMADDVAGLLDVLAIPRAHVLGVSMGGFIAQEFALAYRDRLRGLVLVSTAYGGPDMVPIPAESQRRKIPNRALPPEERLRAAMTVAFAPGYVEDHPDVVDALVRVRLGSIQPRDAWMRQASASFGFDTSARLAGLTVPTLILHGDQDRVVPVENATRLASRLPNAELHLFTGAGHLVYVEQAAQFNAAVLEFLAKIDSAERR